MAHSAFESAPHLLAEVSEVERIHRALEADVENADLAFCEGYDLHAGKAQVLEQRCDVLLITRQSIKRFRDHHVEAAAARVHQELLIAWTQHGLRHFAHNRCRSPRAFQPSASILALQVRT